VPPGRSKSAISEKEITIFELRKVPFPEKHLLELLGACLNGTSEQQEVYKKAQVAESYFCITNGSYIGLRTGNLDK